MRRHSLALVLLLLAAGNAHAQPCNRCKIVPAPIPCVGSIEVRSTASAVGGVVWRYRYEVPNGIRGNGPDGVHCTADDGIAAGPANTNSDIDQFVLPICPAPNVPVNILEPPGWTAVAGAGFITWTAGAGARITAGNILIFGFDIDCAPAQLPAVVRFRAKGPPAPNCTEVAPDPLPFTESVAVCAPSEKKVPANPFWKTLGGTPAEVTRALAGTMAAGEIVTTGFRQNAAAAISMYLSNANIDGDVMWSRRIDTPGDDYGHAVIQTANGDLAAVGYSLLAGGYDGLLARYSSTGVRQWVQGVVRPRDEFEYSLAEASDGGLVVTGRCNAFTPNYALTLFKLNANNNAIDWSFHLGGMTADDRGSWVIRTSDGGYAVVGYTQSYLVPLTQQDLLLLKVNAMGALQWVRSLGFPNQLYLTEGRGIVETPDGGLAVVGFASGFGVPNEYLVAKFTGAGGLLWLRLLAGPDDDTGYSITNTDDGRIATCGYSVQPNLRQQGVIAVFDQLGNLDQQIMAGRGQDDVFRSILQSTSPDEWVVAGYSGSYGPGVEAQLLAAYEPGGFLCEGGPGNLPVLSPPAAVINPAVDYLPNGIPLTTLLPPDSTLSTIEQTTCKENVDVPAKPLVAETFRLKVTNPTRGTMLCELDLPRSMTLRCSFYDMAGRRAGEPQSLGTMTAGAHRAFVHLQNQPAGVYYVTIAGDGARATARTVLLH